MNFTTGIYSIFRGLNSESNKELGEKAIYGQALVNDIADTIPIVFSIETLVCGSNKIQSV